MSSNSDLQSTLELLQMNDYVSLAVAAAVIYDYFLTFSREIDYVWRRPWTWVSSMFVLVRYIGLCWAILVGLDGSTLVPGPLIVSTAVTVVVGWAFPIFYNAADLVMIMRVYAMWNRSKIILYALLFLYVPQVIVIFIFAGIYYDPDTNLSVAVVPVGNFSICSFSWINTSSASLFSLCITVLQLALSTTLLVLAVAQTSKQSLAMYRATKQWQPNRYILQLVKDGFFYFLVVLLFNLVNTVQKDYTSTINSTLLLILTMLSYITICPVMPRFIISTRELFDRDHIGRWKGMDTGFGGLSQPFASANAAVSAMVFADAAPEQEQIAEGDTDESEGIQLEAMASLGDGMRQA